MATSDQLKALLQAYVSEDRTQFTSVAMQIAANAAKAGHGKLAEDLRKLIDDAKLKPQARTPSPIPIARPKGEVADLLTVSYPKVKLNNLVLSKDTLSVLQRVLKEHRSLKEIRGHGLMPRKKLLLLGPPGTGKTMTASAVAGELNLPLFVVRLDRLITRYMGETAGKLRLIFDAIKATHGVYLFDEFDSIGSERGLGNDVGEIRRVVNSFLQMVEEDGSDSVIIAATNHAAILDKALFRRFDDIIEYSLPTREQAAEVLKSKLAGFKAGRIQWLGLAKKAVGLSYGDLTRAVEDAIKHSIIERRAVANADLLEAISERKLAATAGRRTKNEK